MIDVLQVLCVVAVLVAVVALSDWRWGLLVGGLFGFVVSVRWELMHRGRGS